MLFEPTPLAGAFVLEAERLEDDRGFFARTFCRNDFREAGLEPDLVQCSLSFNHRKGTLRGMHYQAAPHDETKLVRCTMGAIHDVILDLRPDSPTFKESFGIELSADNRSALYIPAGLAHGFLTLADDTEVFYQMSVPFHPGAARGVRWNDPAFGIEWPAEPRILSDRDRTYPDFQPV